MEEEGEEEEEEEEEDLPDSRTPLPGAPTCGPKLGTEHLPDDRFE